MLAPDHLDAGGTPDRALVSSEPLTASRVADLQAILNQRASTDDVAARFGATLDLNAVVVAGHSYGAIIVQALAGARTLAHDEVRQDRNAAVKAIVAFCSPGTMKGFIDDDTWSAMGTNHDDPLSPPAF